MNRFRNGIGPNNGPWFILFSFALVAAAVLFFRFSENLTATLFVVLFFSATLATPLNGVAFLALSLPFFLGASHRPYFSLYEILVYGTLLGGYGRLFLARHPVTLPFPSLVVLLGLSALLGLPFDLKEYGYHLWAASYKEIWFQLRRGYENAPLFHLRALANLWSGIGLFVLTAHLFRERKETYWETLVKAWTALAAAVCFVGLLILYGLLPSLPKSYLTLSLAGIHEGALSALAFNRQYLAQFLILIFPFACYLFYVYRHSRPQRLFYGLLLVLFAFSVTATMQRSALLVLCLEIFLLSLSFARLSGLSRKKSLYLLGIPVLFLGCMILWDWLFLDLRFLKRFSLWGFSDPDHRRWYLWKTAWRMFTASPLLGVGLGKYSGLFPHFFREEAISWKVFGTVRGEPHSFYFQVLAEQGLLGLSAFLLLVGAVFFTAGKGLSGEGPMQKKGLLLAVLNAVAAWLMLGFFHNPAYVRSLGVLFWILLGWAAALTGLYPTFAFFTRERKIRGTIVLAVLVVASAFQLHLVLSRPLSPDFQTGLYGAETLPDGSTARWTAQRAVFFRQVLGEKIHLTLSAPLPGVNDRPQRILLRIEGKRYERELKDDRWHRFTFPAAPSSKDRVLIRLETSRIFNPCQAGRSKDDRDLGVMIRED